MALKGKIYSLAKQREDIDSRNVFESMIKRSADQNSVVMDGRNLAAGSIFADQISAGAITTGKIKADAVTTDKIIAGAITTGHLAANSVTAQKISVDKLSAITSDIGTITAGIIRSRDNSIDINLNTGIIDLSKPLTINSKPVATSEQVTQAVDGIDGKVAALSTRMSNAELKIEPSAIVTTVTGHTTFKDVKEKAEAAKSTLDSKSSAWDAKATTGYVDGKAGTAETNAKNYAKKQVDNIEVGGRNLFSVNQYVSLRNSEGTTNGSRYSVGSSGALVVDGVDGSSGYDTMKMVDLKANTEYIFTFNIPINDRFSLYNTDGVAVSVSKNWNSNNTQLTFKMANVDGYIGGKFYPIEDNSPAEIYLMAEKGNKATDWTPAPEDVQLESDKKTYLPVRYIRDWQNGSTSNASNHWYEIEAYVNGENVAKGKTASNAINANRVTDGNRSGIYATGGAGKSYIQVDLGKIYYNVDSVGIWHYYNDERTYKETMTEVSPDGTNWYPIFDSAVEGEYKTSAEGRVFPNTWARYEAVKTPIRLTERISTAEQKITDDAIRSTVMSSTTFKDVQSKANNAKETLDSKSGIWDSKATTNYVDGKASSAETNAKSHAEKIAHVQPIDGTTKKFINLGGMDSSSSSINGYLVIKTPITSNYMTRVKISGYNYQNNNTNIDLVVGFYAYSSSILQHSYLSSGDFAIDRVSLARDSNGRAVVIIGHLNTNWKYLRISIDEATIGYQTPPDSYKDGWSAEITTDISAYDIKVSNVGGGDVNLRIDNAQNTADTAKSTADTLNNTTVPQLVSRVNTAENKITDSAIVSTVTQSSTYKNEMTGKVSVDEIISRINQTSETISIEARRVNLQGAVTFSSFGTDVTSKLDDIESDASTAKSTASSAQSTANTAKSTADTANTTASEAKTTAAAANSTASTAKTTADNASSTASTAKATADTASSVANTARSTANTANTTASNALTRVTIHDTRNENETPAWYYDNYPMQIVQEFKSTSTMGIGASLETYGTLLTTIPWRDSSGGRVKQEFKVKDRMFTRDGSGTTWTAWSDSVGDSSDAKTKTDKWSWKNTTEIDGGSIRTGTIIADKINVAELSSITSNIGTVNAGLIKSRDESIIINLDEGLITLGKPLKIQGKTVATEDDISSLGYGDIISKSGQEIFTDQAEDSAAHVEIGGQSYQHTNPNARNMIPTDYKDWETGHYSMDGSKEPYVNRIRVPWLVKVEPNTTYYWDAGQDANFVVRSYNIDGTFNGSWGGLGVTGSRTTSSSEYYLGIALWNTTGYEEKFANGIIEPLFQLASHSDKSFEEYVPKEPTPDYPVEIENLNDFDVISSVGRQNLLKDSSERILLPRNRGDSGDNYNFASLVYPTVEGQTYTISADVDITDGEFSDISVLVNYNHSNSSNQRVPIVDGRITRAYTAYDTVEDNRILLYAGGAGATRGNGVIFRNIKIEKGSKSTDWTPVPEDITPDTDHPLIDKVNLSLSEPLRSVGDVKDRIFRDSDGMWKVERNVKEITFGRNLSMDGMSSTTNSGESIRACWRAFNDKANDSAMLSTHFEGDGYREWNTDEALHGTINKDDADSDTLIIFNVSSDVFPTLSNFNSWLIEQEDSGNPVKVLYELKTSVIETLDQELQDKLNTLKSFKDSNYVYTVQNTEDLSDQIKENLMPTLHATFKGSGWLPKYNAEQARIDLLSETNDIRNDMDNLVTLNQYNLNKEETDGILNDYQAAIDVARRELNGLVNEDGELILGQDGKPLQKGVVNEVLDLLSRTAAVESDYGEHSRKLKFMDTQFVMGTEGMFIGDTETRTGIMISPRVEETTEHEARASRIDFLDNNRVVAYISSYMMEISRGIFVQSAQIGEHKIETIGDGHTTFQWIPQ